MALTREDLLAIGELLDEKLEEKLEEKLDKKLDEKLDKKLDEKLDKRFRDMEDRLDQKLGDMEERFDQKLGDMEERFDQKMESQDAKYEKKFASIEDKLSDLTLHLENVTDKNIQIIAEGHLDLSRKLDEALKVENEKELLIIRVRILEDELRRAKERLDRLEQTA